MIPLRIQALALTAVLALSGIGTAYHTSHAPTRHHPHTHHHRTEER